VPGHCAKRYRNVAARIPGDHSSRVPCCCGVRPLASWSGPTRIFSKANDHAQKTISHWRCAYSLAHAGYVFCAWRYDNFNRADGTLGTNWTTLLGANDPAHIVKSNSDLTGEPDGPHSAFWSADSFSGDQIPRQHIPMTRLWYKDLLSLFRMANVPQQQDIMLWVDCKNNIASLWRIVGYGSSGLNDVYINPNGGSDCAVGDKWRHRSSRQPDNWL